jgi:hypothetical protein
MKKTTINVHTLEIDYCKMLEHFVESNKDIITDLSTTCVRELREHLLSFAEAIKDFDNANIKRVFQEGYTMMLLDEDEFEYIEDFFTRDPENEDIQLKIVRDGEVVEIISSDYLQY